MLKVPLGVGWSDIADCPYVIDGRGAEARMRDERLRDRREDRIEDRRAFGFELIERNVRVEASRADERGAGREDR